MGYGYCYDATGSKCSGKAQPGVVAFRNAVRGRISCRDLGIYNCRPVRGGGSLSTHGEGRGWDCGLNANNPTEKARGDHLAAFCVANAPVLGIQRVIWNRRQWDARNRAWRAYGGTSPHTDHLHIELCWAAARNLSRPEVEKVWDGYHDPKPEPDPEPVPEPEEDDMKMFLTSKGIYLIGANLDKAVHVSSMDEFWALAAKGIEAVDNKVIGDRVLSGCKVVT